MTRVPFLLSLAGLVFSLNATAQLPEGFQDPHPYQSQSFYRLGEISLDAGLIQVILPKAVPEYRFWLAGNPEQQVKSNALLMFDKRNPFPETEVAGSNYLFLKGGYLATLSADGFLMYKGRVAVRPGVAGGVWFVTEGARELYAVDSFGYYLNTGMKIGAVRVIGGNYLIDSGGTLVTIRSSGNGSGNPIGIATRKEGWNFSGVTRAGGSYFLKADGTLVTIDSRNGYFIEAPSPSRPAITGGNYFIGENGILHTVAFDGRVLTHPEIVVRSMPLVVGYSSFKLDNGQVVAVDADGMPHSSLIRVSTTGVRVKVATTLDIDLDPASFFVPRIVN